MVYSDKYVNFCEFKYFFYLLFFRDKMKIIFGCLSNIYFYKYVYWENGGMGYNF